MRGDTAPRLAAPVVVRIPLRTRFRSVEQRVAVLWQGPAGWTEWSPFPEYSAAVAARWLAAAREGAELAFPPPRRARVPVNAIVPAVTPAEAHALVAASGCRTAKVKVAEPGQARAEDLARVEAVRDALGPSGRIRIDANGAWDVDEAARRLAELGRFDLEYAEQPCATLEELRALRRRTAVPLACDEGLRQAADPSAAARGVREAADVAILKVQPLGGVRPCLELAEVVGVPVVVSSAVETSVGLAAGLALAAALPELPYACGLGTQPLLAGDVVADPLVPADGWMAVRRPSPDPTLLERWALPAAAAAPHLARLAAARAALEDGA